MYVSAAVYPSRAGLARRWRVNAKRRERRNRKTRNPGLDSTGFLIPSTRDESLRASGRQRGVRRSARTRAKYTIERERQCRNRDRARNEDCSRRPSLLRHESARLSIDRRARPFGDAQQWLFKHARVCVRARARAVCAAE